MAMWLEITSGEIKSPIEQIYFIAFNLMAEHYSIAVKRDEVNENESCSLYIYPKFKIGKFKVDFLVIYVDCNAVFRNAVIELDGHDFHDKDKNQRAYEKSRDRFLIRQGFSILHFTGSELFNDPYKAVLESFVAVGLINNNEFDFYNPINPLGLD